MHPVFMWCLLEIIIISIIIIAYRNQKTKYSRFLLFFDNIFEWMYNFFEEILWKDSKHRIKSYVTALFFIIIISNLLWVTLDFLNVALPGLENYISIPTSDSNFNLAMAIVSILMILFLQIRHLWPLKFFYEYIPFRGKKIIDIERWNMPAIVYYPAKVFIKIFDIVISMFVWALDIIGVFARIISLTFRLTWNMTSWTILLWIMVMWINWLTQKLYSWLDLPIIFPIILYLQSILVALIQAFVFSLLVAIFIKVSTSET